MTSGSQFLGVGCPLQDPVPASFTCCFENTYPVVEGSPRGACRSTTKTKCACTTNCVRLDWVRQCLSLSRYEQMGLGLPSTPRPSLEVLYQLGLRIAVELCALGSFPGPGDLEFVRPRRVGRATRGRMSTQITKSWDSRLRCRKKDWESNAAILHSFPE